MCQDEHISFFVEPPPLDIMGSIYGPDHPVWFPGSILYEHKVDLHLEPAFKYHFVETPERTALLYDRDVSDEEFFKKVNENAEKLHYIGESISEFEIPYKKFKGTTRQFFLDAPDHNNWQEIKDKYAATVPHVMVYPSDGNMKVSQVRKVQINNRHFKP